MKKNILILPGDGIGKDICRAVLPILETFDLPITLTYGEIGWECWQRDGDPIPSETWEKIAASDAILLGATTSKGKAEAENALPDRLKNTSRKYVSPIIQLRQKLGLYANIRPFRYISGPQRPFRACVVRENTEGLYSGLDFKGISSETAIWLKHPNIEKSGLQETTFSVRLQTRFGLERLFHAAFTYAKKHKLKLVTLADKPNVLRESGQFAKDIFEQVALQYPDIKHEIHNVDAVGLWLVKKPERFGVIVAENMFGDILSDVAAGVMGGLGLAASMNIGENIAYFEPVHGSAPHLSGKDKANPSAMFYTLALLLEYLGFSSEAEQINNAVDQVIKDEKFLTYDLNGVSSTSEMATAIVKAVAVPIKHKTASVITVGSELVSGQYVNTNLQDLSQRLKDKNIKIQRQFVCDDNFKQISETIIHCMGTDDIIVICGGLGPTSDDKTREAVALALQRPLLYNEKEWEAIKKQLQYLNIPIDEQSQRQAFFPKDSHILDNPSGTAAGFYLSTEHSCIVVLPGPPSQAIPMLESYLTRFDNNRLQEKNEYCWSFIGINESEIAAWIDKNLLQQEFEAHYLWRSPYVIVQLVTYSSAQLDNTFITQLKNKFKDYLVGDGIITAKELILGKTHIQWTSPQEKLQNIFSKTNTLLQKANDQNKILKVTVQTTPPFETVLNGPNDLGNMELNLLINGEITYNKQFPYTKPLLKNALEEHAYWLLVTHLNHESKND